jgi:hypothetical protein
VIKASTVQRTVLQPSFCNTAENLSTGGLTSQTRSLNSTFFSSHGSPEPAVARLDIEFSMPGAAETVLQEPEHELTVVQQVQQGSISITGTKALLTVKLPGM